MFSLRTAFHVVEPVKVAYFIESFALQALFIYTCLKIAIYMIFTRNRKSFIDFPSAARPGESISSFSLASRRASPALRTRCAFYFH